MIDIAAVGRKIRAVAQQVDLEPVAVVVVDDAPDELHPVARREEAAEIADPELAGAAPGLRARRGRAGQVRPAAPRQEHCGIVAAGRAGRDAGDAGERDGTDFPVAARRGALVFGDRRIDLAELEQRLGQVAARAVRIRPQRHGASQRPDSLPIGLKHDRGAAKPVPGLDQRCIARKRAAVRLGRRRVLLVEMQRIGTIEFARGVCRHKASIARHER